MSPPRQASDTAGKSGTCTLRIVLPAIMTVALFIAAFFLAILPQVRRNVMRHKRIMIEHLAETALAELQHLHRHELAGEMTRKEAQAEALMHIRELRYGLDGAKYFWISSRDDVIVMHPLQRNLEGGPIPDILHSSGRPLKDALFEAIDRDGAFHFEHMWPSATDPGKMQRKLSYAIGFKPWGWIIGTGISLEDARPEVRSLAWRWAAITFSILILTSILVFFIVRHGANADAGRSRAQEALEQSEKRFRELAEMLPEIVFEVDERGMLSFVNRKAHEITGYSEEDLEAGFKAENLLVEKDRPRGIERMRRILDGETLGITEFTAQRADGTTFPILAHSEPIVHDGKQVGLRGIIIDISERKRAQAALREKSADYHAIFDAVNDGLFVAEIDTWKLVDVNEGACEMFGYSRREFRGLTVADVCPSDGDASEIIRKCEMAAGGKPQLVEARLVDREGRRLWVEISLRQAVIRRQRRIMGVARDITARKALEEQLRQAQKMEAVGQLAGGVAHDFNNLLTAILGYADILDSQMQEHSPLRAGVENVRAAAYRAARLTRQLLALSRRQMIETSVFDVNELIGEHEDMLATLLGERISIEMRLDAPSAIIKADPSQIEQVILNLAVNARDAMGSGGTLVIETTEVNGDSIDRTVAAGVRDGHWVQLTFTDSGIGMSDETKSHIFEPFFTTKGDNGGTGLGLSTVYGIVKQHKGYIAVESSPGAGATFRIFLPKADVPAGAGPESAPILLARGGDETILLVEDDDMVRPMARHMLESRGYAVLAAPTPDEALDISAYHAGKIHLMFTDAVMPGMEASELVSRARELRPEMKVLLTSGYSEAALPVDSRGEQVPFLQKPFTSATLADAIRRTLDEKG